MKFKWQSAWNSLVSFNKQGAEKEEWALESNHGPGEWRVATEENRVPGKFRNKSESELSQWHKSGNFKKKKNSSLLNTEERANEKIFVDILENYKFREDIKDNFEVLWKCFIKIELQYNMLIIFCSRISLLLTS